jgi:hypothetical protein
MQPDWAKACYRQAAAHMLLQVRYTCQCIYLPHSFLRDVVML